MFTGFRVAGADDELLGVTDDTWGQSLPTATDLAAGPEEKVRKSDEISSAEAEPVQFPVQHHPDPFEEDDDGGELLTLWEK